MIFASCCHHLQFIQVANKIAAIITLRFYSEQQTQYDMVEIIFVRKIFIQKATNHEMF